ncbi:MAG: hypothetical protein Q8936_16720 [Bacillota bacterium]|nr:hypothetical protein [Bacillota bacterium]
MNFCIASVEYFNNFGFDTTDWRKSTDGTKAIVHDRFIHILIPNYLEDSNIQTYLYPSAELDSILNSEEWV